MFTAKRGKTRVSVLVMISPLTTLFVLFCSKPIPFKFTEDRWYSVNWECVVVSLLWQLDYSVSFTTTLNILPFSVMYFVIYRLAAVLVKAYFLASTPIFLNSLKVNLQ